MTEPTNLRALLGDRYDAVMQAACGCDGTRLPHCYECGDSTWDHECPDPVPCRHRGAGAVLARVLPGLLAEARNQGRAEGWDEGYHAGHEDARAVQATYPEPTPNPYRTEEHR